MGTHFLNQARGAAVLARANLTIPERPDRIPRALLATKGWGGGLAAAIHAAAARYPHSDAVIDDLGRLTYAQLQAASQRLAMWLEGEGIGKSHTVGVLCRNHRGFVVATLGAAMVGAHIAFLNTSFAGPQLADVVESEDVDLVIHDDEFKSIVTQAGVSLTVDEPLLEQFVPGKAHSRVRPRPRRPGNIIVLTSGTTGRPKGAARSSTGGTMSASALLDRIPMRLQDRVAICAPMFHAWGLANLALSLALCRTMILRRQFDPQTMLADIAEHDVDTLIVVPVMLQRVHALGPQAFASHDTTSLRIVASSGSALGTSLVRRTMDRFGPVLYNIYGSTEVSVGTIATPFDLQAAPSSAGRPALGVQVRVLDDEGNRVPAGDTGRVFVGSRLTFDGYTGGGMKEIREGLMSTGDVGHFDESGRLFIEGRADDMIVSGGENVFPAEVEECLNQHPAVLDVAVTGVLDDEFGQRLKAFVVLAPGASASADDIKAFVHDRLARFKVPRDVVFMQALPRNPAGKLLKRELN
jgi:fatty-acyl-CoA synthase